MRARQITAAGVTAAVVMAGGVMGGQVRALAAASTTVSADRAPSDNGLARFREQAITWHKCQTGPDDAIGKELDSAKGQCAEVTVPLDYSHPDGRTIKVALSRLKATDAEHRRGVLLINPGGPGDPGMIYAPLLKQAEPEVAARYDVIGMDSDAARGETVVPNRSLDEGLTFLTSPEVSGVASAPMAIICADGRSSRDPETYHRDIQKHRAEEPLFGPLTRTMDLPCAFWPVTPAEPPAEPHVRIHNAVPVLMVGSTGDPKTPYAGQQVMHRALTASRLVTLRGAVRHLVYGPFPAIRNTCVETVANRYLIDGVLPGTDITCANTKSKASTNA